MTTTSAETDQVVLSIPLRHSYGSTLRTVAAALAADRGMTIDEIDDVKLALTEVFSSLVEQSAAVVAADPPAQVAVAFGGDGSRLAVEISPPRPLLLDLDELALAIIRSSVDALLLDDGAVRFEKTAAEAGRS